MPRLIRLARHARPLPTPPAATPHPTTWAELSARLIDLCRHDEDAGDDAIEAALIYAETTFGECDFADLTTEQVRQVWVNGVLPVAGGDMDLFPF